MATEDLLCHTKRKQGLVFDTQNHLRATARICLAVVCIRWRTQTAQSIGLQPIQSRQICSLQVLCTIQQLHGHPQTAFPLFPEMRASKLVSSSWFELEPGDDHFAVSVVSFYGNY